MKKLFTRFYFLIPLSVMLIFIILSACQDTSTNPQVKYNVSGIIKDEQGNGVPLALIQAFSNTNHFISSDTTDENGKFTLPAIPENFESVTVKISHPDFKPYQSNMKEIIGGGDKSNTQINLFHDDTCKGIIEFYVRNKADNKALSNVEVRLNRGSDIIRKGYTNDDGKLVFENVCSGDYWYRIAKDGYRTQELEFKFNGTDTLKKEIFLLYNEDTPPDSCCNGLVTLTIKDSTEKAIGGVSVNVWKGGTKIKSETTNDDGKVTLKAMCEGEYQISFKKEGWKGQEFNFTLDCDDTVSYTKTMYAEPKDSCCDIVLKVCLKNAENEAVNGLTVKLRKGGTIVTYGQTENGCITFKDLCPGDYNIYVPSDKYKTIEYGFSLKCHDTVEISKQMELIPVDTCCDVVLKVCLKNAKNEAINGASVKVRKGGTVIKDGKTENGCIKFTGLCPAEYSLLFSAEGYQTMEYNLTLKCHDTVEVSKQMEATVKDTCCDAIVKVCLKNAKNEPVSGITVKLRKGATIVTYGTTENGCVTFKEVCEGSYNIYVPLTDKYKAIEYEFNVKCHDTVEISKQMEEIPKDTCCDIVLKVCLKNADNGTINGGLVKIRKNGSIVTYGYTENGCITFIDLCPAEYSLYLAAEGYQTMEYNLTLKCHDTVEVSKQMEAKPAEDTCCKGVVKVYVTDKNTGEPISGPTVKIWKGGSVYRYAVLKDGWAIMDGICKGEYGVSIPSDKYNTIEFTFSIDCNETKTMEKSLELKDTCCNGKMYIRPKDETTNETINGAKVVVTLNGTEIGTKYVENGNAIYEKLCKGVYVIHVYREGYKTLEFEYELGCNESKEVEKYMTRDTCYTAKMKLLIQDAATLDAIAGATVVIKIGDDVYKDGTTNAEGYVGWENLKAPATYRVIISKDGYVTRTVEFTYVECGSKTETIKLEK
jgi:5-hydroxyisourate hydrolase-like protein (transthyretin family)